MSSMEARGGSIKDANRCSCSRKNTTSNEEELQRLRDLLNRVSSSVKLNQLELAAKRFVC